MKLNRSPYLMLMRPANVVTAIADILAGIIVAGVYFTDMQQHTGGMILLILSTIGLYGGGVVLNDFFDADLDAIERPERPIPSGAIPRIVAGQFGITLLILGTVAALINSVTSGLIAIAVALFVLIYDRYAKDHPIFGPLFMGLCRAGNLLLGISIIPTALSTLYPLALVPILFVAAITLTSQGEVKGGNRFSVGLAMSMDLSIVILLLWWQKESTVNIIDVLPFLLLWLLLNITAKGKALINNEPINIKHAVRTGVISLIPLDATIAAIFGGWIHGIIILILLPISFFMAKRFAVT